MLYVSIQKAASPTYDIIKRKWEEELELDISDVDWRWAVELIQSSSLCVRHGLIQFTVLHRLHLSRDQLARMYPGADPTCPRCKQVPGNICPMFWSCPRLKEFWAKFFLIFSSIYNKVIEPSPLTAIFDVAPGEANFSFIGCMEFKTVEW